MFSVDQRSTPNAGDIQVYVVHGYSASPQAHWFPWLKDRLETQGIRVDILEMPSPLQPNVEEWAHYLDEHITRHDPNTYFVAHSLGCISLLAHLAKQAASTRLGGLVLLSGFVETLSVLPGLNGFVEQGFDPHQIIQMSTQRSVIAAKDDTIVPFSHTEKLSEILKAHFHALEHGGHFLASDGFTELPLVEELLLGMMNGKTNR
ncbi:RBBP9/YdeN family alpha/beta hydrolase [Pseudomonas fluorescens]|uniref:RBBP9/YdeN family alpha/beta hydrolase n=1 Tax=Pseudomonas fluorescens TaxID=294 RepID=UPI003D00D249